MDFCVAVFFFWFPTLMKTAGLMFTPMSFWASWMFTLTCTQNKELELNESSSADPYQRDGDCEGLNIAPGSSRRRWRGGLEGKIPGLPFVSCQKNGWMSGLTWKLWTLGTAAAALLAIGLQRLHTQEHTQASWQNAVRQTDRQTDRQTVRQRDLSKGVKMMLEVSRSIRSSS